MKKLNSKMKDNGTIEELLLPALEDDPLVMYTFKDGLKRRELYIDDEIGADFFHRVVLPFKKMEEDDPTKPIHIYINSPGGSVTEGLVLCDLIDKTTTPVLIEVMGYAYSMAGYIAMAGKNNPNVRRVCHNFSFGLIHAGSVGYSGDANKAKQIQEFYSKIDTLTRDYVLSHTNIDAKLYKKKSEVEWYLTADEMLQIGFVDEII